MFVAEITFYCQYLDTTVGIVFDNVQLYRVSQKTHFQNAVGAQQSGLG